MGAVAMTTFALNHMTVARLGCAVLPDPAAELGCAGVEGRNDLPQPLFDGLYLGHRQQPQFPGPRRCRKPRRAACCHRRSCCDRRQGREGGLRLRHPQHRGYRGIQGCGHRGDLHPTDTHADLIERFVRAGKAVFCEKPVDLSLARVQACRKVVKVAKGVRMVRFKRRFDPGFMAVKVANDARRIGSVEMVTIISRDPGAPPADYITRSGGIFRDMTLHDFDMARWLLGEEVETVPSASSVLTDPAIGALGVYDRVNVILRTATGRQAIIPNSRRATYGYDQRIEILGSKGMVWAENQAENRVTLADVNGYHAAPPLNFFMSRYAAAYANEIAAFVAVPWVSGFRKIS